MDTPRTRKSRNLTSCPPDLVEPAIEVVSPSSVRNDHEVHEVKDKQYAARGIPNHLVFGPRTGRRVTPWNPGPDGHLGRDTLSCGGELTVETKSGSLTVDTSRLRVDPEAPHPA